MDITFYFVKKSLDQGQDFFVTSMVTSYIPACDENVPVNIHNLDEYHKVDAYRSFCWYSYVEKPSFLCI